jgi:hypothetical protein
VEIEITMWMDFCDIIETIIDVIKEHIKLFIFIVVVFICLFVVIPNMRMNDIKSSKSIRVDGVTYSTSQIESFDIIYHRYGKDEYKIVLKDGTKIYFDEYTLIN